MIVNIIIIIIIIIIAYLDIIIFKDSSSNFMFIIIDVIEAIDGFWNPMIMESFICHNIIVIQRFLRNNLN